ncbi:MAG: DUF4382 domain-containing protein [Nitrospirae bacterium]|nr:DUF4382 domain-containing protein [Nitrospirota bacterium]
MKRFGSCSNQLVWSLGLVVTLLLAGCGSSGNDGGSPQAGVLGVSLTDAPACGFEEVNVTVSKVRVHQSNSADDKAAGWTDITLNPVRTINLLNLNDPTQHNLALDSLGETPLAAGHYTQVRLVLVDNNGNSPTANWVVLEGQDPGIIGNRIPLVTPSAVQSGIKLIHQFDVGSGQRVDLVLDFDACRSIVRTGNGKYLLKPVIKVVPFVLNGIDGFVDTSLLGNNVVVSAQVNGEIVRATVPNTNPAPNPNRGKFFLARLTPGVTYDVVITADSHATAVITEVPVPTNTSITTVSTNDTPTSPIALSSSATHSISGTVTLSPPTDEPTVFVAAKQTLDSGPTVTVKSLPATLLTVNPLDPTGDFGYNLTLPIGTPSLGLYSTSLPIVFTPQSAAVGVHYTIQAAAAAYQPQSINIPDVSTVSTPQDFTLTLVP